MTPPPLPNRDADHLRTLAIFHYVVGGLSLLGLGFMYLHYYFMQTFFANPKLWENAKEPPPFNPQEFWMIFVWFYVAAGIVMVVAGVLNLMSGRYLQQRKNRMFSLVVAGLNCLQMPFGTVLGVFTLVVLTRESVQRLYEQKAATVNLASEPSSP
jgi:hypothetical protein